MAVEGEVKKPKGEKRKKLKGKSKSNNKKVVKSEKDEEPATIEDKAATVTSTEQAEVEPQVTNVKGEGKKPKGEKRKKLKGEKKKLNKSNNDDNKKEVKAKKRKLEKAEESVEDKKAAVKSTEEAEVKAEVDENKGRPFTVSIALPGSILDNAQSPDLRSYLVGQIARAAVIFNVDEIVVFDESCSATDGEEQTGGEYTGVGHSKTTRLPGHSDKSRCNVQMARILQYLETPQYLRKSLYPKHHDLRYAGLINPLDSPHHMRAENKSKYREGVVLDRPTKENKGSFVDCGIYKPVQIDKKLESNIRVTVEMLDEHKIDGSDENIKFYKGRSVPDWQPRVNDGIYWGYRIRLASSLSAALTECPYEDTGKYDVIMGTSERGDLIDDFQFPVGVPTRVSNFTHLLVVFGGVNGLELSLSNDELLADVSDPRFLFDCYLNTCPDQGSRTIRTEEAIPITLAALRPKMRKSSAPTGV